MNSRYLLLTSLLLAMPIAESHAEEIGRLFFSQAERARLDQLRITGVTSLPPLADHTLENAPVAPVAPETPSENITLDGVVSRSSGNNTVWINQVPQRDSNHQRGLTILETGKSAISLQVKSGHKLDMKPGQTLDVTKGTLREGFDIPEKP